MAFVSRVTSLGKTCDTPEALTVPLGGASYFHINASVLGVLMKIKAHDASAIYLLAALMLVADIGYIVALWMAD